MLQKGRSPFVLTNAPPSDTVDHLTGQRGEEVVLGRRVIYVHYGDGMGDSKLKIPAAANGTARNMNTVAALVALASK